MAERTEQQAATERPPTDDGEAWKAHWRAQGAPWRTEPEISPQRQAYLTARQAITPHVEQGIYPFKDLESNLTRADIEWLLVTHESLGSSGRVDWNAEKEKPEEQRRDGLDLRGACLRHLLLRGLPLTRVHLGLEYRDWASASPEQRRQAAADLAEADLRGTRLEGAYLNGTMLSGADLRGAHLERADLHEAYLERADLSGARLERAGLQGAHLAQANLRGARLEGANLREANLKAADLRNASLDKTTQLNGAVLTTASLDQAIFDNTNLSVVTWLKVPILGDEAVALARAHPDGSRKPRKERAGDFLAAARAYRRLAVALQANGMSAEADGYLYRAQIMLRRLHWHNRQVGAYLFSVLLAVLAGYGYRLWRIFATYLLILIAFAVIYWLLGVHSFAGEPWWQTIWDSFLVSLSAIHGRTTFEQLGAWSSTAWVAAVESVFGIVVEGVFVAMLIQRFFGK